MDRLLAKLLLHGFIRWIVPVSLILLIESACAWGGTEARAGSQTPEKAIEATAKAFTDAFNRGDARAIAALWTRDGVIIDEQGKTLKGRKAIESEYAAIFKQNPKAHIEVDVKSIEFPARMVAIESGFSQAAAKPGDPPTASRYRAVHVLQGTKWLMESVRESSAEAPKNAARLEDLKFMIGNWEIKSEAANIHNSIQWVADNRYIQRTYTVERGGKPASSGVQIIGWDPQTRKIRSWSFDSLGGHGTGYWTATPDGWRIDHIGTLADGTPVSSRDFLIRVAGEDNVLGWRSVNRRVGSSAMPDLREVVLDRVPDKK